MRLFIITLTLALLIPACATLKSVIRTVDDLADVACNIFGTENPEEFEYMVRTALPPGAPAMSEAEKSGFNPAVLCDIKEIVQPFIDDQLRLQQATKTSLRAGMSGE